MDFSAFLSTGELSDITVTVDSKVFKLHKFPLFTKSDFFRTLARSALAERDHITLTDFPGGAETFELVASYCYNVRIDVKPENVCQLRCAAEFLQMTGPSNLTTLTERVIQEILTSARASRKIDSVMNLVKECRRLGAISEQARIVEKCINTLADYWLVSTKFVRRSPSERLSVDTENLKKLCLFPLDWFCQMLKVAKEKYVHSSVLATMIQLYISNALDIQARQKGKDAEDERDGEGGGGDEESVLDAEAREKLPKKDAAAAGSKKDGVETVNEQNGLKTGDSDDDDDDDDDENDEEDDDEEEEDEEDEGEQNEHAADELEFDEPVSDDDIKHIIDALIPELPVDSTTISRIISSKWILTVLDKAQRINCDSIDILVQLATGLLHRFSSEELSRLPPESFVQILKVACKNPKQTDSTTTPCPNQEDICRAVDVFLTGMSNGGTLTPDLFRQIVDALPEDYRNNDDTFFHVIEKLLRSDSLQIDDKEKQAMLETIDYERLNESALQTALDSKLVPDGFVAKAALKLSTRLRTELDSANTIIRLQEEELERLRSSVSSAGLGTPYRSYSSWTRSHPLSTATDLKGRNLTGVDPIAESSAYKRSTAPKRYFSTGTGSASRPETGNATSTYHRSDSGWHRTVPSLASELELHIALGMLEERSDEKIQPSHGDGAGLGSRYGADHLYRDDPDGSHAYRSRPTTYSSRYSSRFGQL